MAAARPAGGARQQPGRIPGYLASTPGTPSTLAIPDALKVKATSLAWAANCREPSAQRE